MFLRKKYDLTPIQGHLWKFMRVHPGNFPTVRLAQLAVIVQHGGIRFADILEAENTTQLKNMFRVCASEYWDTHYRFGKSSPKKVKYLGENAIDLLLVNTVIPFIFAYGRTYGNINYCEKAISFFQQLPPENNIILRRWNDVGVKAENSMESQALLFLKQHYCAKFKCLQCRVGNYLLRLTS
jgi:hypothetical protein